jgi:hypothetical protein
VSGVAGVGSAGRGLAGRLLARGDWDAFRGVAGEGLLVLLGTDPPWAEGAIFLGQDPDARGLYLPTTLQPSVHPVLLQRAIDRCTGIDGPVVLLPSVRQFVALDPSRTVSEERLRDWLA